MSVEFKDQGFPGWYQDDPNKPTILRANVATITSKSGGISPIVAEFNYGDGSIQYYEVRGGVGFNGPRVPLFTQSASGTKTIQNQGNLDQLKPQDISRIESSVKGVAFKANQKLASDKEKEDLKNSQYYKSQGNIIPTPTPASPSGSGSNPPVGAGTSSTPITQEQLNNAVKGDENNRSPNQYKEHLIYPLNLRADKKTQDYIQFTMIEYIPKQLNTDIEGQLTSAGTQPLFISKSRQVGNVISSSGTVTLPIQPSITDTNAVTWNDQSINPFSAAAAGFANSLIAGQQGNTTPTSQGDPDAGKQALKGFFTSIFSGGAAGGEGQQIFTRTTGAVLNPNLELLFSGPTVRSFSFSFSMSARSDKEAIAIKKIIRFFKQGMSVKRAVSSLFLKSPHIFEIKYVYGKTGSPHPWLNSFKECALTSCTVNYTPSGSYATFVDGAMTQYDLSLTFSELEPIYDDDYKGLDENEDKYIGF